MSSPRPAGPRRPARAGQGRAGHCLTRGREPSADRAGSGPPPRGRARHGKRPGLACRSCSRTCPPARPAVTRPYGRVARTGPVQRRPAVPPAARPGWRRHSISSRRASGGLLGDDAVADDLQLAGAGDAGHLGHESRGQAHHPLGERGRQPGPAGRPRLGGRRRGVPEDVLPAADRRLVLSPRDRALAGSRPARGQGRGRDVQVRGRSGARCRAGLPRRPWPFGEQPVSGVGSSRPSPGSAAPAWQPWPARRWMITSGRPVCRLAPEGRTGPATLSAPKSPAIGVGSRAIATGSGVPMPLPLRPSFFCRSRRACQVGRDAPSP